MQYGNGGTMETFSGCSDMKYFIKTIKTYTILYFGPIRNYYNIFVWYEAPSVLNNAVIYEGI